MSTSDELQAAIDREHRDWNRLRDLLDEAAQVAHRLYPYDALYAIKVLAHESAETMEHLYGPQIREERARQAAWRRAAPKPKEVIPRSLRMAVFERDGHRCLRCSTTEDLTADHITPESAGGITTLENLQTLCRSCNSRKGVRLE